MYLKQIVLLVIESVILVPAINSGFEIISTTTERGVNKDDRCQQEVIKILGNNLQEQHKLWVSLYNSSYESQCQKHMQHTRQEIAQLFDKKFEEGNAEFAKKQKELVEIANKHNDLQVKEEMRKQKELIEGVNDKLNDLLQHFDKKMEEMEAKLASKQEEALKHFKEEIENITLPRNCLDVLKKGSTLSGVYTIRPNSYSPSFEVRCDMDTRGGGWTYVLNRFDGSQDFYLDWQNYKNGFGNLNGEFWLGLQHLYELTGFQSNHLLVELVDWDNKHYYAMYSVFGIGNEEEGYPINLLDGYSGDATDCLTYHKKMKFSTPDRDQDIWAGGNLAVHHHGPWWHKSDFYSNLAGTYFNTPISNSQGMIWWSLKYYVNLKKAKMMVRP